MCETQVRKLISPRAATPNGRDGRRVSNAEKSREEHNRTRRSSSASLLQAEKRRPTSGRENPLRLCDGDGLRDAWANFQSLRVAQASIYKQRRGERRKIRPVTRALVTRSRRPASITRTVTGVNEIPPAADARSRPPRAISPPLPSPSPSPSRARARVVSESTGGSRC